jgi:uncharacterized protein (TIGR00369 family)
MDIEDHPSGISSNPFADMIGIELVTMDDGTATAELEMRTELSSNEDTFIAHGGATYTLADHAGGAAAISLGHWPVPTIDMRIDYLAPVTDDLRAEAEVIREGRSVVSVDVDVKTPADGHVATTRGLYKISGSSGKNPWTEGRD